jgi:Leucine-rich repeat (LRR) protein
MENILKKIHAEKDTIRKINLSEQYGLTGIPEIIGQCPNLENLNISFNEITDYPRALPG